MSDTLGSLVDKLSIVNLKMWNAQEMFYKIRHMSFEEFKNRYYNDEGMEELYKQFKKGIDLNLQRNDLIDEIDFKMLEFLKQAAERVVEVNKIVQQKHKSY